jgi:fructose-bisphosphate aldolase class 1
MAVKDLAVELFGSLIAAGAALAPFVVEAQREGRYPGNTTLSGGYTVRSASNQLRHRQNMSALVKRWCCTKRFSAVANSGVLKRWSWFIRMTQVQLSLVQPSI